MLLHIAIYVDAAAVSTKPIRQGQKAQAGLVSGTASAALAGKSHSKKRSRKEILLSDDSQEPMDDTYVDSAKQENMVEEADDEFEPEVFQYDDNYD
jgi:hypothetical protein